MPYRSPEWVRRNGRERTIDALDQLRGNRRTNAKVPYQIYLEEMESHLSDALDVDDYTPAQRAAIIDVQSAISPLMNLSSEPPSLGAVEALEAAADRAFLMTADGDWLTDE